MNCPKCDADISDTFERDDPKDFEEVLERNKIKIVAKKFAR